ncbi:polymerase delta-interacting protein 2-like [Rhopilema esculentum]|uniref:polymerase delta-interacting protein 2-like n=1 Tax=Rhopilema esculentum TaxID=499914 RepID=UPI0031DDB5C8|eukprot:gene15514-6777_t
MALRHKSVFLFIPLTQTIRFLSTRLAEVGRFERPKTQGKYESGQLFLHRIFGYRGVVLFPWVAKLYDRDLQKQPSDENDNEEDILSRPTSAESLQNNDNEDDLSPRVGRELKGETVTYYQSLIDQRDCPFIRAQPEAVTFLGNQKDTSLYAIPGLDYVNHEDVLPYTTTEDQPIQHELFERFLIHDPDRVPSFSASEALRNWHGKNHKWLELSDVHRETTEDIRVTVIPFFMGSRSIQKTQSFWWRYSIRLENLGVNTLQLRERHWRIFSLSGTLETVRGRGVVGQEPVLSPRQPAFQYSSHVSLQAPSGHMWGTYRMERPDGTVFDVRIPPFSLESK